MNSSLELAPTRVSLPKMMLRGLMKRCAWCGGRRAFFVSYFKKADRCQSCGLNWQRNLEGFELGSATMGVFITFGSILAWMLISVVAGVPLVPLLVVAAVLAICMPVFTYPLTYTVWFGVHLFMNNPTPEELADAAAWREAQTR
ncbi:MAG: DUF983 domain-containing protein [Ilumatobacteraceae bacterium]|jgi:uncharacterized protein (DUF983 family)|nr:DUF983 domain-containing protein [Ilumatobacteraceae bacterium]